LLNAKITFIANHLPANALSNEDIAREFPEWGVEKIFSKTGIRCRHIAAEDETASDLAYQAALKVFAQSGCTPDQIDYLLFCTQSPDYALPTTACLLQERLKLPNYAGALDFNLGCSGFVYGLSLAKGLIETNQAKKVLLLLGETYSKYLSATDKSVRTIFGDGASAVLIEASSDPEHQIGPFVFGTDGSGGQNLIVQNSGARANPAFGAKSHLFMDGPEILNFTLQRIPQVVNLLCEKSTVPLDQIDAFVFHQANRFILDQLRRKLKIDADRFVINMEDYGNTVSATIPMALERAVQSGQIRPGARLMLVGFGVGYSWGACLARWM
jgi:3-oxoacyl-[acyl-carrier-protein] synthase-3